MFERWALELLTLSETQLILIGFAFSILGGLAGWQSDKGQSTLLRAPYFAATALIILCIYLAQWLWVFAFGAVQQGLLFLLVSAAFGSFLVAGFFTARIARARSRDAFGKASYAVLAFIPFMNLILIGMPSLQGGTERQKKIFNQLSGGTGVAIGLLFLVLLGLSKTLLDEKMQELAQSNKLNSNEKLDVIAENLGVEETLKLVVSTLPLPYQIDENVVLIDLQASGTVLTRTMQITIAGFSAPGNFRELILQGLCATQGARDLLKDGAQFHDIYLDSEKNLIAEIDARDADCRALGL